MTKKSGARTARDQQARRTKQVREALGKDMMMSLVGYLVKQLGGEVAVDLAQLADPRDVGMAKDSAGRLIVSVWDGNFSQDLEEAGK